MLSVLYYLYTEKSTDSSAWEKWLVFDARLLKKPLLTWGGHLPCSRQLYRWEKLQYRHWLIQWEYRWQQPFAVVNRIDDFAITPEQNIAHAMTSLMAQNKGAGKNDRMREGFRCGMILELVYGAAVMLICLGCQTIDVIICKR